MLDLLITYPSSFDVQYFSRLFTLDFLDEDFLSHSHEV